MTASRNPSFVGSSPRMRGALGELIVAIALVGIIPAYAGSTPRGPMPSGLCRDHPRVCGEHSHFRQWTASTGGSSPRMRGALADEIDAELLGRIIPAYAGSTARRRSRASSARDHPRVCGEHGSTRRRWRRRAGSSPRMRGAPRPEAVFHSPVGIIPAYAGSTVPCVHGRVVGGDHPRVCGEHGFLLESRSKMLGSSPRMRGALPVGIDIDVSHGIIPAYAGSTSHPH